MIIFNGLEKSRKWINFRLSANINEDQKNHFQSSRGLSYFLSSIGLKITNDSLYAITITKIVFVLSSLILFVSVGKFCLTKDIDILILIILTLIFSNRLLFQVLLIFIISLSIFKY